MCQRKNFINNDCIYDVTITLFGILKHAIKKRIKVNIKFKKFSKFFFNITSSNFLSPFLSFVNDQEMMTSAEMGEQIGNRIL